MDGIRSRGSHKAVVSGAQRRTGLSAVSVCRARCQQVQGIRLPCRSGPCRFPMAHHTAFPSQLLPAAARCCIKPTPARRARAAFAPPAL